MLNTVYYCYWSTATLIMLLYSDKDWVYELCLLSIKRLANECKSCIQQCNCQIRWHHVSTLNTAVGVSVPSDNSVTFLNTGAGDATIVVPFEVLSIMDGLIC